MFQGFGAEGLPREEFFNIVEGGTISRPRHITRKLYKRLCNLTTRTNPALFTSAAAVRRKFRVTVVLRLSGPLWQNQI